MSPRRDDPGVGASIRGGVLGGLALLLVGLRGLFELALHARLRLLRLAGLLRGGITGSRAGGGRIGKTAAREEQGQADEWGASQQRCTAHDGLPFDLMWASGNSKVYSFGHGFPIIQRSPGTMLLARAA